MGVTKVPDKIAATQIHVFLKRCLTRDHEFPREGRVMVEYLVLTCRQSYTESLPSRVLSEPVLACMSLRRKGRAPS